MLALKQRQLGTGERCMSLLIIVPDKLLVADCIAIMQRRRQLLDTEKVVFCTDDQGTYQVGNHMHLASKCGWQKNKQKNIAVCTGEEACC